ncbi:MAG TPA: hypothetical protein VHC22_00130 [Pirellulales bacterium]|nr:hypothetical protein [Pirellulales bacterium]
MPELPDELQLPFENYDSVSYDDELGVHLVRMLNLHPELVRFRQMKDLAKLSTETKQLLLNDMNRALGLRPLQLPND